MGVMMMALAPDYGRRIRLRRQAMGMTQKELGRLVGKSESAVISWEKYRHAPLQTQGAIEAVLGISLDGPEPEPIVPQNETERQILALKDGLPPGQAVRLIELLRADAEQQSGRANTA